MTALCRCGGSGREVIHHPAGNGAEVRRCRACGGTGIPYPTWAPAQPPSVGVSGVPVIRTVADAEELIGRGAEMIHARDGIAEGLAAAAASPPRPIFVGNPEIAGALNDLHGRGLLAHAPPPHDLAAENAALRAALDASGELLAEAHEELKRLRGER